MTQPGVTSGYAVSDHVRLIAEHVGPVLTDVLGHSGDLTPEHLVCYATELAALVDVEREEPRLRQDVGGLEQPCPERPEHLVRFAARQAASVEVDREVLWEMGLRVREAGLLSEDAAVGDRCNPWHLAKEVCEDALVRL